MTSAVNISNEVRDPSDGSGEDSGNDDDYSAFASLPKGAECIIRQIAAEQILAQVLNKVNDRENVDYRVIYDVVKEFPGTCFRSYNVVWEDGSTRQLLPLAIICCLRASLDTVKAVYDANPDAVFTKEPFKDALPFHLACAFEASLEVVEFIHFKNTKAIETPRNDGVLPLHLASGFYLGEPSVVNFLIDQCPDSANKVCNLIRWSPLHSACHGGVRDTAVLERLHQLNPAMIDQNDRHGRTPLHLACRSRSGNAPAIDFLVKASPAAVNIEDELDGWTPVFLVCIHQSPDTIEALLDSMPPNSLTVMPHGGSTLLHWAAIANSPESVDYLARRFPEMLKHQTTDGAKDTPLSCAIDNDAPLENIKVLIERYPAALYMKDGIGRRPLIAAKVNRASKAVVELLEESERKRGRFRFFLEAVRGSNGS
eukprot:CAMPEP_0172459606 /NCGR_PEP_ID=MMETSP1065-20121228/33352_1 /TAXON_ID=265537 /ORGANISM="Amphiprora paludosa, Strain CCMP125" /LENGTH=425 /DNA_ID=CAMNT_0013214349 /DNA_START=88 /DNA_END=1365 /DNA_ORIENTATION=-